MYEGHYLKYEEVIYQIYYFSLINVSAWIEPLQFCWIFFNFIWKKQLHMYENIWNINMYLNELV